MSVKNKKDNAAPRFPGTRTAQDGSAAVVLMETAASEAAGAYPITPSTQMGEGWAAAVAKGALNVNGRRLIFFEPEGEHAAAAVTAGMSMVGLRSTNFSSGQGIAYMHESLYAAVGKRLTYVLNVACRAMTKQALNVHAGHDDYHAVDDTGMFQLFGKDVQSVADLNLIAHRIAELSLNPGVCAQDGFLTSHVIESLLLPERDLVKEYLGDPSDLIDTPTPAQRHVLGGKRRRIPEMFNLDYPAMIGVVQNQDSYASGVAAQRPFYFDHVRELTDRAFDEYARLTGRRYARVMGVGLEDADYVIVGQGSVVSNAEAVAAHLREKRGIKVGVLDLVMFRPFPSDLITSMLKGKRGVAVLERVDQPLAVDLPVLREIRAAMSKGLENGRAGEEVHPGVALLQQDDVPDFYSGCFGLGSRDLQPGDLIAAVDNMLEGGKGRRQFYLGIDFIRKGTRLPKLQIEQEKLLEGYPALGDLALDSAGDFNLLPSDATSIRIHSVGGWGAITMGKNLALTAAELCGLHIKANPKYGSEKKGQPTTFYASLASEPILLNCELKNVTVVLSPDPNVFRHSNPLAGLGEGGVFIIQSDLAPADLWNAFPRAAQREIRERNLRVFFLDAFKIAMEEASDIDLRYRMQGAAFMGAFFKAAPLMAQQGLDEQRLFDGIAAQLDKKFGHRGVRVVEDNLRVIRRGYDELVALDPSDPEDLGPEGGRTPVMPAILDGKGMEPGIGHTGRFWEQVCHLYKTGEDGIADPFLAISAIPAATSTIRDMTDVRFEVPKFLADKCSGCSACWTQCPDSAIPGLVSTVDELLDAAIDAASDRQPLDRIRQASRHIAKETQRVLRSSDLKDFSEALRMAYRTVAPKLAADPERRAVLDREFAAVATRLDEFPVARTSPFFDLPESREKGSGALLSITINPETCKGCNLCVDVCPDGALVTIKQDEEVTDGLRRSWDLWKRLPDTDDKYINIASLEEGIGILPSLLLKKENYLSMLGGDGACMGCGEKTGLHLVLAAVNAMVLPRVHGFVGRIDGLIEELDRKARGLLAADADLDALVDAGDRKIDIPVDDENRQRVQRLADLIRELRDLRWRYTEGPSGKGRAPVGFANSTGCSSVWGSTYPYNPYPFPWVNHLFQDAPSIAIGIFEGHMRKMADGFAAVRRAELEIADAYVPEEHDPSFESFGWKEFSDEEFLLCPPIFAVGGDGAMLDIGFQNLSRLMASGKPLRVVVLDTQVYSNTGGQACTSGYLGQVSDMAEFGKAHHGKEEMRKELSLIAIAHRGTFVLQSSQANAAHLLGGVLKGLQDKRPAIFLLHCPCPPEHGLADDSAMRAAKLSLESRAFPLLRYDPDAGETLAARLDLDGNPAPEDTWPVYDLKYLDEEDNEQVMELPMTIADWAFSEMRFRKHYRNLAEEEADDAVPFADYLDLPVEEREGKTAFIYVVGQDRKLGKVEVSSEIVALAEDRLDFWRQLQQMAGDVATEEARSIVGNELEEEFDRKLAALRTEYEGRIAELKTVYPRLIARRMAEGLMHAAKGGQTIDDLLGEVNALADLPSFNSPAATITPLSLSPSAPAPAAGAAEAAKSADSTEAAPATTAVAVEEARDEDEDEELSIEPWIETLRCTTCNECTNLNRKIFAYNEKKQAFILDAHGGPFKDIVVAAERCPARIIHPGAPLNPKEKDLAKWVKRAAPFN